ncbi:hypothetical protein LOTGIDRAFT_167364 [Lottia gigantea]|uniref:Cell death regulator Aven n=1 Tax=Lottia gigantea TaxID=225164 RepID=V3Z5T7_LOTGI|nr:hypothetical protein LOTGIDRAFT_167364 [Lottia gigantea]ESO86138.1 hypothetical protein LOTGIDRAFT_167364 [Lottia gigantea]
MRPDEHKKKKSAQYKQKHGVPKDTNDGKGTGGKNDKIKFSGKPVKGKNSQDGASSSKEIPCRPSSISRPSNKQVSSNSSDSEEDVPSQGVVYQKKTFSKRKIVSNWDRYEIPHVDENKVEESKGSDFSTVLNLTGSSLSQFRFKSEKNLDKELSDISASQYSNLDLQDLSTCIDTLPLYKQLAIDQHLFTEDQIEKMNTESKEKSKEYISHVPKLPSLKAKPISNINDRDFELEHLSSDIENNLDLGAQPESAIPQTELAKSVILKQTAAICEQECELEQLLSMGNSTSTDIIQNFNIVSNGSIIKTPPDLKSTVLNETQSALHKDQGAVPGMEDLEDWLDSVLDT